MSIVFMTTKMKRKIRFGFDRRKALETAAYLVKAIGGLCDVHLLMKLAYFADRYHIRTYARPIWGEEYIATPAGIEPRYLKELFASQIEIDNLLRMNDGMQVRLLCPYRGPEVLTSSEVEALNFSLMNFADCGLRDVENLIRISKVYPEWIECMRRSGAMLAGGVEVDYYLMLGDADTMHPEFLRLHLVDPYPIFIDEDREDTRRELLSQSLFFSTS